MQARDLNRRGFLHHASLAIAPLVSLPLAGAASAAPFDDPPMGNPFAGLEPAAVWRHFERFTQIPRPSGAEDQIARYVLDWAAQRPGFRAHRDDAGNVVIHVPASPGREKAPPILVQGHLDQVVARNPAAGDLDPRLGRIRARRANDQGDGKMVPAPDGAWLIGTETNMGADNGVGCSVVMALLEDPAVIHGPIVILFSTSEETGLDGSKGFDPRAFQGNLLINVDSETFGVATIGSAGGRNLPITFERAWLPLDEGQIGLKIAVSNLKGGHSGVDIQKHRLNALKALGHLLSQAGDAAPIRVGAIEGGDAPNSIPRSANAELVVAGRDEALIRRTIADRTAALRGQFPLETELGVSVERAEVGQAMSREDSRTLVNLIEATPSGVLAMFLDQKDQVETSTNLGIVRTKDRTVTLTSAVRSADDLALEEATRSLVAAAELAKASANPGPSYPGWKPQPQSELVRTVARNFSRLSNADLKLEAVHAGLEVSVFMEKMPTLQSISIGPDISGAHSSDERVRIATVTQFHDLLRAVLVDYATR